MNALKLVAHVPAQKKPEIPLAKKAPTHTVDPTLIYRFVGQAPAKGMAIGGENGLMTEPTKRMVESVLDDEITGHLGYQKHERSEGENSRNGTVPRPCNPRAVRFPSTYPATETSRLNR